MINTILESFDIWTRSQTIKSNGRTAGVDNQRLLGIDKLRELILELAVRGKLVPQDEKDEPAEVLIKKVSSFRKTKDKNLIENENVEFELPSSWKLIRLKDYYDVRDGTHDSPKSQSKGYPLITSKNLSSGKLDFYNVNYISESDHLKIQERSKVDKDDILFAMIGTIGNPVIVDTDIEFSIKNVALFKYYNRELSEPKYLKLFLQRASIEMKEKALGGVQSFVSLGKLRDFPMPLPPLAEQHRIVAKVDELMALCDQLEQQQTSTNATHHQLVELLLQNLTEASGPEAFATAWQRIATNFDTLFTTEYSIDQLKQTILQLAVMGKLVPQNPKDEPASELLNKIAKEKERLVKEGKIKKQEKLPEITEEEKPFELPGGWEWVRFIQIGEINRGKSKHRPRNDKSLYIDGKYPLVQTGDVARANGIVTTYTGLYNEKGLSQSRMWPKGTLCITIAANIADSSILGFDACFPDSIVGFIPSHEIQNTKYFEYFVRTAKSHLIDFAPSTAQKNINLGILETVLIPLPPKNEISRIVAKVDELFALCDALKERIKEAQETQGKLAEGLLRGCWG